jgi:hypothetical protein
MKHLTKFVKYIVEAKGVISDDDLEALTIPFKHMGITYRISDEQIATVDEFKGRKYKSIHFSMNFKTNDGFGHEGVYISDDKVWEFLDELLNLRNHLDSKVLFNFGTRIQDSWYCYISYLIGDEVESGNEVEILKVYNELREKYNKSKTNFSYSMTFDKKVDKIVININDEFTPRRWNNFVREIDLSNCNVDIKQIYDRAQITITHK